MTTWCRASLKYDTGTLFSNMCNVWNSLFIFAVKFWSCEDCNKHAVFCWWQPWHQLFVLDIYYLVTHTIYTFWQKMFGMNGCSKDSKHWQTRYSTREWRPFLSSGISNVLYVPRWTSSLQPACRDSSLDFKNRGYIYPCRPCMYIGKNLSQAPVIACFDMKLLPCS